jgi:membrane protease subunit HflK
VGSASRLKQEADAYKARIVAQATGDAERFKSVLAEYQKAPQVTRDRMYIDTMQQIYANVGKVMVDSRQGSNLLYLPLDKLMAATATSPAAAGNAAGAAAGDAAASGNAAGNGAGNAAGSDVRSRDLSRSRDRDGR